MFVRVVRHTDCDGQKSTLTQRDLYFALQKSVETNFGTFGSATIGSSLQVRHYNPKIQVGVVRASKVHAEIVQAALTFITTIKEVACRLEVFHLSGSLRTCASFADSIGMDLTLVH